MSERTHRTTRVVSVVAATVISLACGTNYAYSAWGPQFAERMEFSSTQSNLIGTFGNLGMYGGGIPVGILVDSRGPTPGVILGGTFMGIGYFAMYKAFQNGPGSVALPWLCFFAVLTGIGGAAAFSGAIKTFPTNEDRRSSNPLRRTKSKDDKAHHQYEEPGTLPTNPRASPPLHHHPKRHSEAVETPDKDPDETSSLVSKSSSSSPGDVPYEDSVIEPAVYHDSHHVDIRGFALLKQMEFYQLWVLLGILTGVGLMTIK
ncbi:MAG: hypothetical protein Q9169_000903 [Polycauliona sp. 2 TL-2023]